MLKKILLALTGFLMLLSCELTQKNDSQIADSTSRAVESGSSGEVIIISKNSSGDVTFTVTYSDEKMIVQLFVKKSGVQFLGPIISDSQQEINGNYEYSYTASADNFESGQYIEYRYYSYNGSAQCFSPGPAEADWSQSYLYDSLTEDTGGSDDSGSNDSTDNDLTVGALDTIFMVPQSNGGVTFSLTVAEEMNVVHLFARKNGNQDYVIIGVQEDGETENADGSYTYSVTREDAYETGDILEARFYTFSPTSGQIFLPGPGESEFTSYTYGDAVDIGNDDSTDDSTDETDDDSDQGEGTIDVDLIPLTSGMEMTLQFENKTNFYDDSQVYLCVLARDSTSQWCFLEPDGTLVPLAAGESSEAWTYNLADINGFQIPSNTSSGRCYFSYEKPVIMSALIDGAGNIGIVQPNLADSGDPNQDIYFEWMEFTVGTKAYWGNSTQVDQYCFSYTESLYAGTDSTYLVNSVGIEYTRDEIFSAFSNIIPSEFSVLVEEPYRIVAPCKIQGGFSDGDTYGDYMDSYVDEVWTLFNTQQIVLDHPRGRFVNELGTGDQLVFYKYGLSETDFSTANRVNGPIYITDKPNSNELFEGSGVLAEGVSGDTESNDDQLALQAWFCAALNRHNATALGGDIGGLPLADWNNVDTYYPAPYTSNAANHYARFWHEMSLGGKAYGFCYDDVNDQATLLFTGDDPRALVIDLLWN
ncbi:MAG: beta-1,3-glucanase family protein [Spirochaetaceae bacterium]|jgi:hypothetical protein|nr:beta-1,3-glucanase family protein [Spirochaetaceae bacterium]